MLLAALAAWPPRRRRCGGRRCSSPLAQAPQPWARHPRSSSGLPRCCEDVVFSPWTARRSANGPRGANPRRAAAAGGTAVQQQVDAAASGGTAAKGRPGTQRQALHVLREQWARAQNASVCPLPAHAGVGARGGRQGSRWVRGATVRGRHSAAAAEDEEDRSPHAVVQLQEMCGRERAPAEGTEGRRDAHRRAASAGLP